MTMLRHIYIQLCHCGEELKSTLPSKDPYTSRVTTEIDVDRGIRIDLRGRIEKFSFPGKEVEHILLDIVRDGRTLKSVSCDRVGVQLRHDFEFQFENLVKSTETQVVRTKVDVNVWQWDRGERRRKELLVVFTYNITFGDHTSNKHSSQVQQQHRQAVASHQTLRVSPITRAIQYTSTLKYQSTLLCKKRPFSAIDGTSRSIVGDASRKDGIKRVKKYPNTCGGIHLSGSSLTVPRVQRGRRNSQFHASRLVQNPNKRMLAQRNGGQLNEGAEQNVAHQIVSISPSQINLEPTAVHDTDTSAGNTTNDAMQIESRCESLPVDGGNADINVMSSNVQPLLGKYTNVTLGQQTHKTSGRISWEFCCSECEKWLTMKHRRDHYLKTHKYITVPKPEEPMRLHIVGVKDEAEAARARQIYEKTLLPRSNREQYPEFRCVQCGAWRFCQFRNKHYASHKISPPNPVIEKLRRYRDWTPLEVKDVHFNVGGSHQPAPRSPDRNDFQVDENVQHLLGFQDITVENSSNCTWELSHPAAPTAVSTSSRWSSRHSDVSVEDLEADFKRFDSSLNDTSHLVKHAQPSPHHHQYSDRSTAAHQRSLPTILCPSSSQVGNCEDRNMQNPQYVAHTEDDGVKACDRMRREVLEQLGALMQDAAAFGRVNTLEQQTIALLRRQSQCDLFWAIKRYLEQ